MKLTACTLWLQLEDMFQLLVTPQGIQLKDEPTKVYAIGAMLISSKVPLEVLQIKEVCRLIDPCLLIGTRE